jgi:hypothetical protein
MAIAIEANTRSREGKLQDALDLLLEVYISRLSEEHLDMAIDLLDNERKALFFIGLHGVVRDRWLERHAGVQLIVDNNEDVDDYDGEESLF